VTNTLSLVCTRPLIGSRTHERDELAALVPHIGATPLATIELLAPVRQRVHLKLESANPSGSMKDRSALEIIRDLERAGRLAPGDTLVDSTSGNFGVALAWLARARGYRFVAVSDPNLTAENLERMRRLGAQVEIVTRRQGDAGYLPVRIERARQLLAMTPRAVLADQYGNPANPRAYAETTGPELSRQVDGAPAALFVPASTGGMLAGLAAHCRRALPGTRVVAVDGEGSSLFGGRPGPRLINGLGSTRPSAFLDEDTCDEVVRVPAAMAVAYCRALRDATGILAGGTSGAALAACELYVRAHGHAASMACVCPDHGWNYRSTLFSDGWLRATGVAAAERPLIAPEWHAVDADGRPAAAATLTSAP